MGPSSRSVTSTKPLAWSDGGSDFAPQSGRHAEAQPDQPFDLRATAAPGPKARLNGRMTRACPQRPPVLRPTSRARSGSMAATSTNITFSWARLFTPLCHQGMKSSTPTSKNTDPAFQYSFRVPMNDAPGMYWYHPHLHGQSTLQVNGGAAGAAHRRRHGESQAAGGRTSRKRVLIDFASNSKTRIPGSPGPIS